VFPALALLKEFRAAVESAHRFQCSSRGNSPKCRGSVFNGRVGPQSLAAGTCCARCGCCGGGKRVYIDSNGCGADR
jgi:hypothetical protein